MNIFKGTIISIQVSGSMSLVSINAGDIIFSSIVLETQDTASYLKEGNEIKVIFKETETVIGKGLMHQVSMQNKIPGQITEIEKGILLSKINIDATIGKIVAIITSNAVDQLQLQVGETIMVMIKTNEIMLSQ